MKKILNIYYCWDETGNPNGTQNRRQYDILKKIFNCTVIYRKFTESDYGSNFISVKSPNLLFLDRILLKLFQFLKLVISVNILVWSINAYKMLLKRNEDYDIVILTGTPYMLFWLAKKIAKKNKAKLIVQMYDPLSMNNYVGGSHFFREKLEANIINDSNLIILHSKIMYDKFVKIYPNYISKFKFIPFSSESKLPDIKIKTIIDHKLKIVHAGSLQKNRNVDLLLESLRYIPSEILKEIEIQLIGYVSNDIQSKIKKSGYKDNFKIIPFLEKAELNTYYLDADVLLVIDSFKDNINIFFPSKICEYLMYKKLILLITPQISETRWVLENSPELCFDLNEVDKLKTLLIKLVMDRNFYNNKINYSIIEQFLPQKTMKILAQHIEDLFHG